MPNPPISSYRRSVREDDLVRLPDGRTATVLRIEYRVAFFIFGSLRKVVTLEVRGGRRLWLGFLPPALVRVAGDDIDTLELIATAAELAALGSDA
jgi:hypothetical protein